MNFISIVDGKVFIASKINVDEYIDDVNFNIRYCSQDRANNFQIICDSETIMEYVLARLKRDNPDYELYDLSQNESSSLLEFNKKASNTPLLVYGFDKYLQYLNSNEYDGRVCSICGREYTETQKRFYTAIEMGRDSFFDKYKTRLIFVMTDSEYNVFLSLADDFASYYPEVFDFNKTLISKENSEESLFSYLNYTKKGLKVYGKIKEDEKN